MVGPEGRDGQGQHQQDRRETDTLWDREVEMIIDGRQWVGTWRVTFSLGSLRRCHMLTCDGPRNPEFRGLEGGRQGSSEQGKDRQRCR
jgi:hypothetical protein